MKKIITYGTFDLLHRGHINLLRRARELGNYLIVGVTSDNYDQSRGKLNVVQSLEERMEAVRKTGLADLVIVEEMEGQKIRDIEKYGADVFVLGSDWVGKFDYLGEYCEVVYLERTKGISSTELRAGMQDITNLGVVGCGRIAGRFITESRFISAVEISCVYGRDTNRAQAFADKYHIPESTTDFEYFLQQVDAVYVAVPHHLHHRFVKQALQAGKHVLCEKPMVLTLREAEELFALAEEKGVVLMEAFKTAYAPAFRQLLAVAGSGAIGAVKAVDASFTKLVADRSSREFDPAQAGGALTELGSYPLLAISQLLGQEPKDTRFICAMGKEGVDTLTRVEMVYPHAMASGTVGLGMKREGDLCIAGTNGYIYVPAPWWKTQEFEVRYEDTRRNQKHFYRFEGDGLRYELAAFVNFLHGRSLPHLASMKQHSLFLSAVIEQFRGGKNTTRIL